MVLSLLLLPVETLRARAADETVEASLPRSAEKATTYQAVTTLVNGIIFAVSVGTAMDGLVLTTLNTTKSWLIYTANDYTWDALLPPLTISSESGAFDMSRSLWRTTGKVLTYRPIDTAIKFALIYLYTESTTIMLISGTASSAASTAVFYLNDFAWDLYDWSERTRR